MKQIRVGVLGYGNLGMAVEELILHDKRFRLVRIFSHRKIASNFSKTESIENLEKYKNKIDVLFLCGGSSSTLMEDAKISLKYFNTIDAFDTHKKIITHIKNCDAIAKQNNKVAFCSYGWDPGIFSFMRVLFISLGENVYTSWGRGVSQGHSEAIRKIQNVNGAIQYTIPIKYKIKKLKSGEVVSGNLHWRQCYVVADKKYQPMIKKKIINLPNYFHGYKTIVKFVSEDELKKHNKLFHCGEVFTLGNNYNFSLKTESNPHLTAKIMIAYSVVLFEYYNSKQFGAYSILDVPIAKIIKNSYKCL